MYKAKDSTAILVSIVLVIISMGLLNNHLKHKVAYANTQDDIARVAASPTPTPNNKVEVKPSPTPAEPTELQEIVSYIAYKFEPEGKDVVVRAINCFYSESGLRPNAVGQNSDGPRSKDWNVAQLNDYWHNLTPEQKSDYKANIDKAYEIYKGRARNGGNGFSAWYGKLCN